MTTSNVPLPTFDAAGFTSPAELDVYDGVISDWNAAFGGVLNTGKSTPQGQLSQIQTALIGAFNDLFVQYVQQTDPAYAQGRMQDAIGRINFISRIGATSTIVVGRCYGATGTTISVGSLAIATDDTIYQALTTAEITAIGYVDVQFAALTTGPIACPAGSLNKIYRTVIGWDSITNLADGEIGQDEETPAEFETRRYASVAVNGIGFLASVRGAVLGVSGVADCYVTENDTSAAVTVGTQTILANSLYVCVQGGLDADVGAAIFSKKSPGCNYSGSTSVTVADENGGYLTPPTYTVKFQRAASLTMNFVVTIANKPDVPSDAATQIATAITGKFPSLSKIAETMYASGFFSVISALGDWARIESVTINGNPLQAVGINQFPALGTISLVLA